MKSKLYITVKKTKGGNVSAKIEVVGDNKISFFKKSFVKLTSLLFDTSNSSYDGYKCYYPTLEGTTEDKEI